MDNSESGIDWSYSNAMRYESCPRSLFYHYWHHQRRDSEETGELYTEENVWYSTPGALIGTAVHAGISSQVKRWSCGQPTSRTEAHETASNRIESGVFSELNGETVSESRYQSLIETATDHLDRFLSVMMPQIRSGRYILHEESSRFTVADTAVWVRPDLCHRDREGTFVVTDWKTRQPDVFEDHSLQLQTYALWAKTEFEPDIENLRLQLGFTGTGEFRSMAVTDDSLENTRNRIRTDIEAWSHPTKQSKFPTKPESEKCQSCSYQAACPTGQEFS
ncbi:PD-(D/E)XK nuclease family protein [Halonotius sp. GCM10025705]|uniref:PD-(D/E)XK nuclease family protein n=1 Tax=Halonotius sp. GCM10025705 TaxID=3252678 RepID=UPI00360A2D1B